MQSLSGDNSAYALSFDKAISIMNAHLAHLYEALDTEDDATRPERLQTAFSGSQIYLIV